MKHILYIILLGFVLPTGCISETDVDVLPPSGETALLSLRTRPGSGDPGTEEERIVKTLRLMIFDKSVNGNLLFNKLYDLQASSAGIQNLENDEYRITERIPKISGNIRICLIANEIAGWRLGHHEITYTQLGQLKLDFINDYAFTSTGHDGSVYMDISAGNGNFVMKGEADESFGPNGIDVATPIGLERTVAKVSLELSYDMAAINGIGQEDGFTLIGAMIERQPLFSSVYARPYDNDNFISGSLQMLNPIETAPGKFSTDKLVFYVPEHLLNDANYEARLNTYILITGAYSRAGAEPVTVSYKIPLGNGVQKLYNTPSESLVKDDYTVSRNTHYKIKANVARLGEQDGLQFYLTIEEWVDGGEIEVDRPAPYLNLSDIDISVNYNPLNPVISLRNRIYFWTNQAQPVLLPLCERRYNGTNEQVPVKDMFYQLDGESVNPDDNLNFCITGTYPVNGYFNLYPTSSGGDKEYTYYLNFKAGILQRMVQVRIRHFTDEN